MLCTQNNLDANVPIPAPGDGYVIWDGARRDREVWAGDLRLASLVWLGAYADPTPVRNSLYMLWQGRHIDCDESGMVPGSGSTHQTFYEWTFWFLVNAWEYYLWTGDRDFLYSLMAPNGLDRTLGWVKRRSNAAGLVEATISWMYTFKVSGEMAALAIVQVAGLEAMANLFEVGKHPEQAREARALAAKLRTVIAEKFYDDQAGAMRMLAAADQPRYPLDANAWAVIYKIGTDAQQQACLRFLTSSKLRTEVGLRCIWPTFEGPVDQWSRIPAWSWVHNTTVWPYPNCYAAMARMEAGDMAGGLETLKAFHRPIDDRGHSSIWEAMKPDGSLPFGPDGNTLSFAHAWGGAGACLLQERVLGLRPTAPGFARIDCRPDLGPLKFARGSLPTPKGVVEVELERTSAGLRGKLRLPEGVEPGQVAEGVSLG